jgi:N-acetylneuraminic acid mutarotase
MKKKSTSQSAFFNLRVLIGAVFCLGALAVALFAQGNRTRPSQTHRSTTRQDAPGTQRPDVVQMIGPVRTTTDVRHLPYIPNEGEIEERRLTRYQFSNTGPLPSAPKAPSSPYLQKLLKNIFRATPTMPGPLLTFDGVNSAASQCGCLPPDTDGDVGPNHYVEAVNVVYKVFDKNGNTVAGPFTFNTLFQDLVGTPCSGLNAGDPFVLYDHLADRWLISDFAFDTNTLTGPFYQCIAVSTSPDPAGTYNLYALQHEPAHSDWIGDYPKFALWSDPQPGGAYHLTVNLFDFMPVVAFEGVRVFALDRASMLAGGPANAIAFTVSLAGVGDSYSFVAANFRTGDPPPAGRDEMVLAVDATIPGATLTQVHARFFHVDFVDPGMSTFGVGADHTPNAEITVNPFVQAWTAATYLLVPQQGTSQKLDTLGDKIMTPVVYQNRNGTESLWADQTTMLNWPNGPTVVSWYQFDVTGGTFPATPVQQQDWSNGNDGLWRWMPSIAVDADGNTAIGYSTSNTTIFPSIRYAGRLESDPPSDLAQGEAIMQNGGGAQTSGFGRWGDYTYTSIDPSNGTDFWHVNEYYTSTSSASWSTKIGKFNFVGGGPTPTPTPVPLCHWDFGPDLPNPPGTLIRAVGVFFPADGNFYTVGGRTSDAAGSDFQHVLQYNPTSNTWTEMGAMLPDNQVNNMACGVLNDSGTDYIYCVGGSAAGQTTAIDRVFRYNPLTDTIESIAAPWPGDADGITLPGGFAVANNKLYTVGGFQINVAMTDQIWEFTPTANTWLQRASLPVQRGYVPATTIGGLIYTAGGSLWDGVTLQDTNDSFVFDPAANTVNPIANIPRATAETRAVNFNGKMYVLGGGRVAPNPSNEVDVYDPGTNSWTTDLPFNTARRNFPADTNGTDHIWLAGGYDDTGVPIGSMEIFTCPQVTPTPTPTATPTPTPTTPTPTPTVTVTPTPRVTPRPRPTPHPRPTPP